MSLVRQIGLIPAGCQPWNLNVVDASGTRFVYAATLAIYIYEVSFLLSFKRSTTLLAINSYLFYWELFCRRQKSFVHFWTTAKHCLLFSSLRHHF